MSSRGKLGGLLVTASTLALFFVLGGCWLADRTHRWERPQLDPSRFVTLRGAGVPSNASSWEMVPVNLHCPHCLTSLRVLQRLRRSRGVSSALVVLVVDSNERPSAAAVARLQEERVWWDRRGVWRRRWGHRLYGEVLRFDTRGRYVDTRPPLAEDPSAAVENRLP